MVSDDPLTSALQTSGITELNLTYFRNYSTLSLACTPENIVLTGENGAGKTNLLEALSFFAPGKGLRNSSLSDPISQSRIGTQSPAPWAINISYESGCGAPLQMGTGLSPQHFQDGLEKRIAKVNNTSLTRVSSLSEYITLIWLTPQMDRIFLETASYRRRFFDRFVDSFSPGHNTRLTRYEQSLRERLTLLKQGYRDPTWLKALEMRIAEEGVAIAAARMDFLQRLNTTLREGMESFPTPCATLEGDIEKTLATQPALHVEDFFQNRLFENREKDAERGMTTYGIHRTDLLVHWNSMPARFCSTGEQKTLLISLIMAIARIFTYYAPLPPILLLDEVVAHLDKKHREALIQGLEQHPMQTWMTGTDPHMFQACHPNTQFFHVNQGKVD